MQGDVVRVWIDDRHPIFRRGLRTCLTTSDDIVVVGEGSRFEPIPNDGVDVVIFEADPISLQRALEIRRNCGVRLVAIVAVADECVLYDAVDAGVSAVHLRQEMSPDGLVASVGAAMNDSTTLPHDVLSRLLNRAANASRGMASTLQQRELAVLRLLAAGEDTRHIAGELSYSERTVKNIVHDVLMKLNCRNRAHAVGLATRQGII